MCNVNASCYLYTYIFAFRYSCFTDDHVSVRAKTYEMQINRAQIICELLGFILLLE